MNESNGPVNTNSSNTGANTNTSSNTSMNTNANTKVEASKPQNEVKKPVVLNNNANNKAVEKSKTSAVLVVVVLLILVVGGYYIKKNRDQHTPLEQPASAATGLTMPGPVFTTDAATDITATSAKLHATISGLMDTKHFIGQSTYFKYGTSPTNPSTISSFTGAIEGPLTTTITGLQPDTTYYYRAVVNLGPKSVSPQRKYGEILSFKTLAK